MLSSYGTGSNSALEMLASIQQPLHSPQKPIYGMGGDSVLASELSETKRKLRIAQELSEKMTQQCKETRLAVESTRSQAQAATQNCLTLQLELQQKSHELSSLTAALQTLQQSSAEQQLALESGNRIVQSQKSELMELRAKCSSEESDRRQAHLASQQANHEVDILRQRLEDSEAQRHDLEHRCADAERELDTARRLSLQRADAEAKAASEAARDRYDAQQRASAIEQLRGELHAACVEIQSQRQDLHRVGEARADAAHTLTAVMAERDAIKTQRERDVVEWEADNRSLQHELATSKSSAAATAGALQDAQHSSMLLKTQLSEALEASRRQHDSRVALETSLQRQVEASGLLQQKLDNVVADARAQRARSRQALAVVRRQLTSLGAAVTAHKHQLAQMQQAATLALARVTGSDVSHGGNASGLDVGLDGPGLANARSVLNFGPISTPTPAAAGNYGTSSWQATTHHLGPASASALGSTSARQQLSALVSHLVLALQSARSQVTDATHRTAQLSTTQEQLETLRERCRVLETEGRASAREAASAVAATRGLEAEVRELRAGEAGIRGRMREAEGRAAAAEAKAEETANQLATYRSCSPQSSTTTTTTTTTNYDTQESARRHLESTLHSALTQQASTEHTRSHTVSSLESHLSELTARHHTLEREAADYRAALQRADADMSSMQRELEALMREKTRLSVALDARARAANEGGEAAREAATQASRQFELQFEHSQTLLRALQKQRSDLQSQLTETKMVVNQLQQQLKNQGAGRGPSSSSSTRGDLL